ncbi:hypothetical protein [Haloferula sp.]|uniref:hypothetical protein n=1 Tax=Haloferula sp. TaxID=2497595 RepID=UPI003C75661C
MRITINNKVYDTDYAAVMAEAIHQGRSDPGPWFEELYISQRGNWFVYGWGDHPKYLTHYIECKICGYRITPISREEALTWCEKHQEQKLIDNYFSDLVDDA